NVDSIEKFKGRLKNEFEMSDLGKLNYFLGLEFHYASDAETPMEANLKLSKSEDE
ncbi:hypothetical protein A2U01_0086805, partial [Trifolium medium]|nr:hypothetical protein [Trifolium medium]